MEKLGALEMLAEQLRINFYFNERILSVNMRVLSPLIRSCRLLCKTIVSAAESRVEGSNFSRYFSKKKQISIFLPSYIEYRHSLEELLDFFRIGQFYFLNFAEN